MASSWGASWGSSWGDAWGALDGEPEALAIETASVPTPAYDGVPYATTLQATGGTAPYTWAVTSGALPDGLSLDEHTGEIAGTPSVQDAFSFTVTVTDAASATDDQAYEMDVVEAPASVAGAAGWQSSVVMPL